MLSPTRTPVDRFEVRRRDGASPTGLITAADNQGNWIPASAIQVVEPGSFHGYMPEVHQPDKRDSFDQPLCWMPVSFDNSSGGQTWVADDRWGPFQGQMLHLSWGRCTLNLVVTEKVDGVWQGGAVAFPGLQFDSGPIVGRFNPKDGQLYVCGTRAARRSYPGYSTPTITACGSSSRR